MELISVSISGFRNIANVTLDLDPITSLVALNGYGKSNFIDAIDFGKDFIHASNEQKKRLMGATSCIPILKAYPAQDYSFAVTLRLHSRGAAYFVNYGFSFAWNTISTDAEIKTEFLKIKLDEKKQKYYPILQREGSHAVYKPSETSRCIKPISIDSDALVLNKLTNLDELYYLDIVKQVNAFQFFVERHLDARSSFDSCFTLLVGKNSSELGLDDMENIPRIAYYLKSNYPDKYALLVAAFLQLFPNISDFAVFMSKLDQQPPIQFPENFPLIWSDSEYTIYVTDNKLVQRLSFEHLSDGTKRVFLMLTKAIVADIKNLPLLSIEEPENSIHPALFRQYLDILTQLCGNCKLLLSSHSPYIIQYLNPASLYLGLNGTAGDAQFRKIAPAKIRTLYREASNFGCSTGDYLFSLMASSDADELLEYIKKNVE